MNGYERYDGWFGLNKKKMPETGFVGGVGFCIFPFSFLFSFFLGERSFGSNKSSASTPSLSFLSLFLSFLSFSFRLFSFCSSLASTNSLCPISFGFSVLLSIMGCKDLFG